MILMKSDSEMAPSPSLSASSIISWSSSSVMFSPRSLATFLRCLKVILSESSSRKSLKAFFISSTGSRSLILIVIMSRKSAYSTRPEPLWSRSCTIALISSFLGSKPRALMTTLSSLASIFPVPSVSNRSKASFISSFCSCESGWLARLEGTGCFYFIIVIIIYNKISFGKFKLFFRWIFYFDFSLFFWLGLLLKDYIVDCYLDSIDCFLWFFSVFFEFWFFLWIWGYFFN